MPVLSKNRVAVSPKLQFISDAHTYLADGKRQPSITGIIRDCGLSGSYEFRNPIHSMRGRSVHEGAAIIIAGGEPSLGPLRPPHDEHPDYIKVHGEIPNYWKAMREAHERIGFTGATYECGLIDVQRGYAGRFDFLAWSRKGKNQLWDIKSGTFPFSTVIQLCGYEDLIRRGTPIDPEHPGIEWMKAQVNSGEPFERCGLRLEKSGKWTAVYECSKGRSFSDPMFMSGWRSALALYKLVPNHRYSEYDEHGREHFKSRLSDMAWVADAVKQLKEPSQSTAKRAGENIWVLREAYNLL